jgi:trehalose utilization protein
MKKIRVTIWNEFIHERQNPHVAKIYPCGIHHTLAESLSRNPEIEVRTATFAEPEHGLSEQVCQDTDVMLWWGHANHEGVADEIISRVQKRVHDGMGHELYPIYHHPQIQRVIYNAIHWARPRCIPQGVPRHVPVEAAREKISVKGPQLHDAGGVLAK